MVSFILISGFLIFHFNKFVALPLENSYGERTELVLSDTYSNSEQLKWPRDKSLPALVNVSTINDYEACIPPVLISAFIDVGCKSMVMYDNFQEDRILQLIPEIKCVSSLPPLRYRTRRIGIVCEEVKYNLPVLYRNGTDSDTELQYKFTIDSVSVACIRSQIPSTMIVEKMSPALILEDVE